MRSIDSGIIKCNSTLNTPIFGTDIMRNITVRIGGYDVSIILFLIIGVLLGTVAAATYMWSTQTVNIQVEESLTVTSFPTASRTHPGENLTLDITIENTASVTYTVTLTFTLNDTAYQTNYVTFSNHTYTVNPGTNNLTAWMLSDKKAPPTNIQITTQFYRE
jgi:hypothetical protein